MTVTQTVNIPESHRLVIDVPPEVPTGPAVLTFTPAPNQKADNTGGGCPLCAKHRDPKTGELRFNAETIAAFKEGDAMLRGEIPAKWHTSLDDLDEMLGL